jgi:hypothetical protein
VNKESELNNDEIGEIDKVRYMNVLNNALTMRKE